jgi:hypothetical protein
MALVFFVASCYMLDKHDWEFDIRNHASKVDAHFVKANFNPYNFKIVIVGQLNKEAKLLINVVKPPLSKEQDDESYNQLQTEEIRIPKGKVNIEMGMDLYCGELNIIYIPLRDSTFGDLKIKVAIH